MPKKKHGLFGLHSYDIDYTEKNWNCSSNFQGVIGFTVSLKLQVI